MHSTVIVPAHLVIYLIREISEKTLILPTPLSRSSMGENSEEI